jgi:Domain of unknown function (DUF1707)
VSTQPQAPLRLASEDVIINAPMSYVGSAQRIMRIRRGAPGGGALAAITVLAILLVLIAWTLVTAWYICFGLCMLPYRVLRRGARKRKAEAMRHREMMGTIQGSAAASAGTIVAATAQAPAMPSPPPPAYAPNMRIGDEERERALDDLRDHMLAGRLNAEEFEQRLASAHVAKTQADIDAITTDLPVPASRP